MTRQRVGNLRLVELLGNWSHGVSPLYRELADALRKLIEDGDIRPGTVFPSERSMATSLAVSRTTIVSAFSHLKQTGFVDSKPGSGTWVRPIRGFSPLGGITSPPATVGRNPLFTQLGASKSNSVDFTAAVMESTPAVTQAMQDASAEFDAGKWGTGFHPAGLPHLREIVASRFTLRGVPTDPNQILITAGGQQGIVLIAAAFLQPGDPVVVETPTYPGALDAFRLLGASIRPVAMTEDGTLSDDLVATISAVRPQLTYLIPTFHNPTGLVMSEFERRRFARYLRIEADSLVIEDESLIEFDLSNGSPPRPIVAHYPDSVIIGSASKTFWGGLRVGWIRADPSLVERLSYYKTVMDLASPVFSQIIACHLLKRIDSVLPERLELLKEQKTALEGALTSELPEWRWTEAAGGLSLWARLPKGRSVELSQSALRENVILLPGPFFDPRASLDRYLRLPFVRPINEIEDGIVRLRAAWHEYQGKALTPARRPA